VLAPCAPFCGACGQAVASQQQSYPHQPQYPQQGYPQQGYPQQTQPYPPPQGYPHGPHAGPPPQPQGQPDPQGPPAGYPQQQGYPQQPGSSQPAAYPQPGYPPPQGQFTPQGHYAPPPIRPFGIVMQQRFTRLTGQMFIAPARLFFLCESQKGGLGVALGRGLGGIVGGVIAAMAAPTPGQAAAVIDEPMLFQAVQNMPGSMVMEPPQFKAIKVTMWTRGIFYGGKTYALPEGLDKEFKGERGHWCQANNVRSAGLIK